MLLCRYQDVLLYDVVLSTYEPGNVHYEHDCALFGPTGTGILYWYESNVLLFSPAGLTVVSFAILGWFSWLFSTMLLVVITIS